MSKPELYKTESGEFTLYLPDMDETYHSRNGAVSESQHVFIDQGLKQHQDKVLNVLEVGFGTGLNALLTAKYCSDTGVQIDYQSLEPFPLIEEVWSSLSYDQIWGEKDKVFSRLHECSWGTKTQISEAFSLTKHQSKLEDFQSSELFDVVYFDAFAPKKQAELWASQIFVQLYNLLKPGGILTTYSAAGQLKRNLKSAGFELSHPAGANGKREMTVARKS